MLRDKNLIPLSHQHQRALALCVRIERAQPIPDTDLESWQAEIEQHFRREIDFHFSAEESVLFPVAIQYKELISLVEELIDEHAEVRRSFSRARERNMSAEDLVAFAAKLSTHIRKEERQLFEQMQRLMTAGELADVGAKLKVALQDADQSCVLPNQSTRLRARS